MTIGIGSGLRLSQNIIRKNFIDFFKFFVSHVGISPISLGYQATFSGSPGSIGHGLPFVAWASS